MPLEPYWSDDTVTLWLGDCLDVLREMPDASVDAISTDPPYEIQFMSRSWDASGIAFDPVVWRECLRVLKPGGHLVAFGGTRTWHRVAVAIEDAGWEIRDTIMWIYGTGFPKSLDVSKAIDRTRNDQADILMVTAFLRAARDAANWTNRQIDEAFGFAGMAGHWTAKPNLKTAYVPTWEQWLHLKMLLNFDGSMDAEVWRLNGRKGQPGEAWHVREVVGTRTTGIGTGRGSVAYIGDSDSRDITAPASIEAKRWEGWGTALKPGWEPIVLARKPLAGTVASNVLTHGTGALNIAACRVEPTGESRPRVGEASQETRYTDRGGTDFAPLPGVRGGAPEGRWPTNLIFSHSASCVEDGPCDQESCPVAELDRQSGVTTSSGGARGGQIGVHATFGQFAHTGPRANAGGLGDRGGASRFFPTFRYEAKAPTSERPKLPDGSAWPTVKPLALMRWLARLVTPPGGTILDPFAGTGTTAEAAVLEGFRCILIDQDPVAAELAKTRLSKPLQPSLDLFSEAPDAL
ncbi:DNA methyltransferase [Nonomuraea typhae]|uniref:DNA methyltransferase n=1 Tax=Nonomuraea typhae TaxID=2603600 RepID=UPI001CA5A412|nr:DNA methyltransferase [Nonomuraea typhae]